MCLQQNILTQFKNLGLFHLMGVLRQGLSLKDIVLIIHQGKKIETSKKNKEQDTPQHLHRQMDSNAKSLRDCHSMG